ncbi:hypothetical protein HDU83_002708 [Entophlyctis luteolus]|nr:hypothetical protein HDU83_002708 [Entophlyctis luteolus]
MRPEVRDWANARIRAAIHTDSTAPSCSDALTVVQSLATDALLTADDLTARLNRACNEASKALPRAVHDLEFVRKDIAALSDSFKLLRNVKDQKGNVNDSFDGLLLLDTIRLRMQTAWTTLQEAENWNSLAAELETTLADADFLKAGSRLAEASRSLVLLQGTPEWEERRTLLHNLQNQLEALISPALMDAFTNHDLKLVKEYQTVFDQIHRPNEFLSYYFKSTKGPILAFWKKVYDERNMEDPQSFVLGLQLFLSHFSLVVKQEIGWIDQILSNRIPNFVKLIHQVVHSLKPSLRFSLEQLKNKPDFVQVLSECFTMSVDWCIDMEQELFSSKVDLRQLLANSTATSSNIPVVVKKVSSNQLLQQPTTKSLSISQEFSDWAHPILDAFSPFFQINTTMESAYLIASIPAIFTSTKKLSVPQSSQSQSIRIKLLLTLDALNETVRPAIQSVLRASLKRCVDFTGGFGVLATVAAIDEFLLSAAIRISKLLEMLQAVSNIESGQNSDLNSFENVVIFGSDDLKPGAVVFEDYAVFGESEDDSIWKIFELGLRFLGATREFLRIVEESAEDVRERFNPVGRHLLSQTTTHSEDGANVSADSPVDSNQDGRPRVFECVSALSLLMTSPLNTPKLRNFYNQLNENQASAKVLYPKATAHLVSLGLKTQTSLFNLVFIPISRHLTPMASLTIWGAENESSGVIGAGDIPRIGMSPSVHMTRVGEALLTLPQKFDIHIGDVIGDLGNPDVEMVVRSLPHIVEEDFAVHDVVEKGDTVDEKELRNESEPIFDQGDLIHLWITSLSRATMELLVVQVTEIPKLGKYGTRQLATDVDYIVKVLETIDVDISPDLSNILQVLEMTDDEIRGVLGEGGGVIFRKLAKIRGLLQ